MIITERPKITEVKKTLDKGIPVAELIAPPIIKLITKISAAINAINTSCLVLKFFNICAVGCVLYINFMATIVVFYTFVIENFE